MGGILLIILPLFISSTSCQRSISNKANKPNIVFFLVDDMGWTDLGCYGSQFYETPNIDAFARESVKFTNAYAACHVCSPTRASIMTGKYPASLHLTDWLPGRRDFPFQKLLNAEIHPYLPREEMTIAEVLKEFGYHTAIFGKWHLGEDPFGPDAHGFDKVVPINWNKCCPNKGYHAPFGLDGIPDKEGDYLSDRLTDEALQYLDTLNNQPFFLYLSHFAVHDPIQGRADLVQEYLAKESASVASDPPFVLEGNPDNPDNPEQSALQLMVSQSAYDRHAVLPNQMVKIKQKQDNVEFAAMVESVDESFGRVLRKLEELKVQDNTIVIFFSDNGGMSAANFGNPDRVISHENLDKAYATSNLPLRGAKGWLYEGGIRVPLIVNWPGRSVAGLESSVPVISIDFFPTLLEMLDLPGSTSPKIDGVSFAPILEGKQHVEREAIFWHFPHYSNHGMQSPGGAVRSGDFKLLEYFENGSVQLFNLKSDLGEQHDLSDSLPEKSKELQLMLHDWRQQVDAQMMPQNPDYRSN